MTFHLVVTVLFWLALTTLAALVVQTVRINIRDNRRNDALWAEATENAIVQTPDPEPISSRRAAKQAQALATLNEEAAA